ncbi:MAG: 5-oxoprolinase subunit C family protein [Chloroflexota bacterium]
MALVVVEGGLLTTVQDRGRLAYERYGVPVAGAMDPFAFQAANALVGNALGEAALEITLMGPRLLAEEDLVIAVTGGELQPLIDDVPVAGWSALPLPAGSTLAFRGRLSGCRAYLAVAGGLALTPVLGSLSTYLRGGFGGFGGRSLRQGDRLPLRAPDLGRRYLVALPRPLPSLPAYGDDVTARVVLGPQADRFTSAGVEALLSAEYAVGSASDRMGYRLRGQSIEHTAGPDIVSDGIALGSVQVPGDGQPIVMMADRQTTGGYTKIATVIGADIPLLAQCVPGASRVRFASVSLEEAVRLRRAQAQALVTLAGPSAYNLEGVATANGEISSSLYGRT